MEMFVFRMRKRESCCYSSVRHCMTASSLVLFAFSLLVFGKYDVTGAERRGAVASSSSQAIDGGRSPLPCSRSKETMADDDVVRGEFPSKANQTVRSNTGGKYDRSGSPFGEEEKEEGEEEEEVVVTTTTSGGKDAGRKRRSVDGGGGGGGGEETGLKVPKMTSERSEYYYYYHRRRRPPAQPAEEVIGAEEKRKRRTATAAKQLHIGALFELSEDGSNGSTGSGQSDLAAAKMAIRDINDQQFVPGYHLELIYNDTKCDPGHGADAFYDLVYRKPTIAMLLGIACSDVAKTLAEIVPFWNLVLISHASDSPALSEREKYPTFYRLFPVDSSHNGARKSFLSRFHWTQVAAIHEDEELFSLAMNEMNKYLDRENISFRATLTFRSSGDDLHNKMRQLKDSEARIIIGSFRENAARKVFCQAYHLGLYGRRYVWLLTGGYSHEWWKIRDKGMDCSPQQLSESTDGYFSVDSINAIVGNSVSIAGITTDGFRDRYSRLEPSWPWTVFAQLSYDSVWTAAFVLRQSLRLTDPAEDEDRPWRRPVDLTWFSYKTGERMRKIFASILADTSFMGITGPVTFDGPDRKCVTSLEQNQGGKVVRVGLFHPENNTLDMTCKGCRPVYWINGRVPVDRLTVIVLNIDDVRRREFVVVTSVSVVGIILAVVCLVFNVYNRKIKYIKLSSPKLNNVAVVGCIHVYLAVILHGMDDSAIPSAAFSIVCSVQVFLLAGGFTMSFGAMFIKTYRVHQICRGCHSGLVRSKMLRDTQLLSMIGILLAVDCCVIGLWFILDPIERQVANVTIRYTDSDENWYVCEMAKCSSQHFAKWLCVFYAYKGLLLLFGVYLAWETRRVQIPALNDSRYIGLNIYNVVLSSVTVVSLSSVLTDRPTLSYTLVSALIVLSTTTLLALLFLPKIYAILRHGGNATISISDITVEFNTRRFAIDERRESEYRAEVHNRVHKRQVIELEREILRLERMLETADQSSSSMRSLDSLNGFDSSQSPVRRRTQEFGRYSIELETNGKGSQQKFEKSDSSGTTSLSIRNRYLHIIRKIRLTRFTSTAAAAAAAATSTSSPSSAVAFGEFGTSSSTAVATPIQQNNSQFTILEALSAADRDDGGSNPKRRRSSNKSSAGQDDEDGGGGASDERRSLLHLDAVPRTTDDFGGLRFRQSDWATDGDDEEAILASHHHDEAAPEEAASPREAPVSPQPQERLEPGTLHLRRKGRSASAESQGFRPRRTSIFEWNKIIREKVLKRRLQKMQEELKSQGKPELRISSI